MSKRIAGTRALLGLLAVVVGGPTAGSAEEEAAAPALTAFDQRGWFTCHGFLALSAAERHAYLIGLREGWQTSATTLRSWAASTDLAPEHRIALDETAGWMRDKIDHGGVSYREMLERTGLVCERDRASTVWQAWFDAIRVSARARATETEP